MLSRWQGSKARASMPYRYSIIWWDLSAMNQHCWSMIAPRRFEGSGLATSITRALEMRLLRLHALCGKEVPIRTMLPCRAVDAAGAVHACLVASHTHDASNFVVVTHSTRKKSALFTIGYSLQSTPHSFSLQLAASRECVSDVAKRKPVPNPGANGYIHRSLSTICFRQYTLTQPEYHVGGNIWGTCSSYILLSSLHSTWSCDGSYLYSSIVSKSTSFALALTLWSLIAL